MRNLLLSTALFFAVNSFSQDRFCGATEVQNKWFAAHPELKTKFDVLQQDAIMMDQEFSKNNSQQRIASAANHTIPVVFHILHTGGSENISDAQVLDAVRILNRDYRKLNPDTADVILPFKSLIGDAKITFSLATKDPNGNCTNGIVRHFDPKTEWDSNDFSYFAYTWPPTRYLNIYVVKSINSNAAGYTFLPGSGIPSSVDVIVILSTYVGAIGTGNVGLSRALTHEVGHWFNLPHVWGGTNQPGVSCGDDGVSDTPVTEGFSSCGLLNNSDICTPGVPENVQNYMDYSYCSRMFTPGQANRMQNAANSLISGRNNLSSANNLFNTGITNPLANCIPILDITIPSTTVCIGNSLNVTSYTSNANPTSYLWTANNGAIIANPSAANAQVTFANPGSVTVSCNVANANGNVTKSVVVTVLQDINTISASNDESFESVTMPSNWTVINPTTPTIKWEVTSTGAKFGLNSVYIPGETSPPNHTEILESPTYNFKNNPGAQFTFYYAYARYNAANKDRFKVMATKDCGGTWVDVWSPTNQLMANASAGTTTVILNPSTEWVFMNVTQDCPLFTFQDEASVKFRFSFTEDQGGTAGYGNRMYLDNIVFTAPVGINEVTKAIGFNVFPNPSHSGFHISFTLPELSVINYQVVSITGSTVIREGNKTFEAGSHEISFNKNDQLAKGIYFLNFEINGIKLNKKIIVD